MTLKPGSWLGHYEVLAHIGTGGMGEVYRARDNKLQREVALKLLPKAFAQDPERVARFRREAQMLAQLNHPNIAAIYSVEQTGDTHFLVMELAPGETLRDRIKRGPIPIEEALDIAKQIAAGLGCAHEKPIVHRDLKPANIKVTPAGVVKILDFGLARAFAADTGSSDPADSPTLTGMTEPGVILGTAAYMSPEQARGKTVDKRSDIWALGCVLFEMLTGKHAYDGEDVTDILASVVKSEPDWTSLPAATPTKVRELLRRCLQKDKDRRSRDAAEIQLQIQETLEAPATEETRVAKAAPPAPLWRRAMPFVLTGLATAAIAVGVTVWNRPATPASRPVSRLAVPLPPEDRIQVVFNPSVAISPNGSHVVYEGAGGGGQLYLRSLDSPEVKSIPGTLGGYSPFFSPDGQWLGFFVPGKLMKVALNGGPTLTLCDACGGGGGTWGPDDSIVFSARSAEGSRNLFRVSAAGGMPTTLTQPDSAKGETEHAWPEFLPDGKTLLFAILMGNNWDNAQIAALNLETGERRMLLQGGTYPRYAPTGHLVYHRAGTVMAAPFDANRLEVTGAPAPVLEGVMSSITNAVIPTGTGAAQFGFSRTGSLVYVAGLRTDERTLVWIDRNGTVQPLGAPPRAYVRPALSPDGRQVAVDIQGQTTDIWVYDVERGTLTRLTFEGNNFRPIWMPDGKRIAFPSERGGLQSLFWKPSDGAGAEEQITNDKLFSSVSAISPDGQLAFGTLNPSGGENDIGIFELQGERKITVFLKTPFDEGNPDISPDGRWIAHLSLESGRSEIYVRPFPGPGGKWQISTEGGVAPVWARNGRELFYASSPTGKLMAVDVTTQPTFQAGTPRVVLDGGFRLTAGAQGANYDISPDGQRFLVIQGSDANLTQLNVVLNWFEELKQRVPVP